MTVVRPSRGDADLETYVATWNAVHPDEPTSVGKQRSRLVREPRRLYLLAERDGRAVACGYAGPSDSHDRGFVLPSVLPSERRRGTGTLVLAQLLAHATELGFSTVSSHVDGTDAGSLTFAERHGFVEVDRQVEQVKAIGDEPPGPSVDGVALMTIAERPELLRETHDLAVEGYRDMAVTTPVTISLTDWLAEEATVPEGSFVALAGGEVVGFTGLCRDAAGVVEDGLTVVRRDWRRRGIAATLKRTKLAWASANGIGEIVTWTQTGNEAMRALNERLGYVYRSVSITVRADLP